DNARDDPFYLCPFFSMEDHRSCLVCSTAIDSVHLGMDICRACASFFKRSKTTGVVYPCRQGTFLCSVSKENKFICRRCRFDKCMSVGIVYEGRMRVRAKPPVPLIERIERELRLMIERRRVKEIVFIRICGHNGTIPHPRETVYLMNTSSSIDFHLIALEESKVFFDSVYPALTTISPEEKDKIFKDYAIKLNLIVNYYLTKKMFGEVAKKLMSSVITCYDDELPFDYYYPEDKGNKDFFESSIRGYAEDHASTFLPQFKRAQITDKEFFALIAIVLAEHDLPISDETQQIMDNVRHEIIQNLQCYYRKELGIYDFSTRLGNLMTLNHIVQECHTLAKVTMRFYSKFFDVYMTERLLE
ncbi:hypothetical protein PMAYCL1PPCAC_24374, partial [Pristionchus mayeri]